MGEIMEIQKNSANSVGIASDLLKKGKIAILPTDTIYGFSGIVPDTEQQIHALKGRDEGKPFIQLIADPDDLSHFCAERINANLLHMWPAGITIIVRNQQGGTTGFRCPGDVWLRNVIRQTGLSLYSTSVNKAGQPPLTKISDIQKEFSQVVSLIVNDGDNTTSVASTIVDTTGNSEYQIIRQGTLVIPQECLQRP